MFTFQTIDEKEVRRLRIAQFNGRIATVKSGGLTVTGHVRSVLECKSRGSTGWSITLVPAKSKVTASALQPLPMDRMFAEERC